MKEGGYRIQGLNAFDDDFLPKVTVVTAVYNGEQYLEQTIKSVLQQTYNNIEYIIIDGDSTDNTLSCIQKYNDRIAYWLSEPDTGIYDAWNKAVSLANGDWIAFVGADDILLPQAVQLYINHIKQMNNPLLEFVSAKVQLVNSSLKPLEIKGAPWSWQRFRKFMDVGHVGALHKASLFKKHGLFDISFRIAADYEFLLRPREKLIASYLDEVTVLMRVGGSSQSNIKVFKEAYNAKVHTGGRNSSISKIEYMVALSKFYIKKLLKS